MKRNLLYYVQPRQCSMLAYNLYLLHKYHEIFNGRKVVFSSEEEEGLTMEGIHLDWMLNDTHRIGPYELTTVSHDVCGMEDSFFKMLEMVESSDPEEVSFFAYAKDTSVEALEGCDVGELSAWVEPMYRNNLSDPDQVDDAMGQFPCAGTFKHVTQEGRQSPWSYAGPFFWFNHEKFFTPGWRNEVGAARTLGDCLGIRYPYDLARNFGGNAYLEIHSDQNRRKNFCRAPRNFDPSRVTIVTTAKNRWEFLNKSMTTWMGKGFHEIIVVDWSSDTEVSSHIERMPLGSNRVTVVRVDGEEVFNGGMARNTGARHISSDYALFIDSDMTLEDWSVADGISMTPGRFYHGPHNIPPFGTSLVRTDDFRNINGYSELYPAYGWEDNDLYNRLEESGLQRCLYDDRMAAHIDHDDELRARHRDQNGKMLHETVWSNRDIEKWTPEHRQSEKLFSLQEFWI